MKLRAQDFRSAGEILNMAIFSSVIFWLFLSVYYSIFEYFFHFLASGLVFRGQTTAGRLPRLS